ncbi:nucleotide exchange factor GrpE [Candidatus Woesearchaeota archaeon]|nr:nucleotide exchange factor GrpE [Candidatus Woesearchaeota archaeon]
MENAGAAQNITPRAPIPQHASSQPRASSPQPRVPSSELESLKQRLAHAEATAQDYADHLKRLQAEFENHIKRADKEKQEIRETANAALIRKLLVIVDEADKAAQEMRDNYNSSIPKEFADGIDIIFHKLHKLLEEEGVEQIPAVGFKFDPFKHEAVLNAKSDKPENTIIDEIQKGYSMKGRVIRYSKVSIAKPDHPATSGSHRADTASAPENQENS